MFLYTIPLMPVPTNRQVSTTISGSPRCSNQIPRVGCCKPPVLNQSKIPPQSCSYGPQYTSSRELSFIFTHYTRKCSEAFIHGANNSNRVNGRMKSSVTAMAIKNKAMCFPWRNGTFPSYSQTASGLPSP